jgi:hypothetical protein
LGGDNSDFTGTWDLTVAAVNASGSSAINGLVENAFGNGLIDLAVNNKAIFNHTKCAGDVLNMNITGSASAVLNVAVTVQQFTLNGTPLGDGTYNASTHPSLLSGTGSIMLRVNGTLENLEIYNLMGQRMHQTNSAQEIDLKWLKSGIYIVRYKVDGKQGAIKIYKK